RSRVVVDAINISQIVNYLRTEMVDAGILFDSTAKANRLEFVLIPEKYNRKINVSTAILTFSPNSDKPSIFLKYLETKGDIFRKYGFEFALDKK
ncbi:MAG: ABC transporter substrate-binding protein, partial [Desulfobacteraceae bacterium]|nr:ABC transporter substrate-binding protein [Desulfobacteraceae bacterium]